MQSLESYRLTRSVFYEFGLFPYLIAILGLTFSHVRITLAVLLESTCDYLYDSVNKEKAFIPHWLKKVRED